MRVWIRHQCRLVERILRWIDQRLSSGTVKGMLFVTVVRNVEEMPNKSMK